MTQRKRGGQPHYILSRDGYPIVGLSRNKTDERYYATHSQPRKWFGKDLDTAIILFREWQSRNQQTRYKYADLGPASRTVRQSWEEGAQNPDPAIAQHYREALTASDAGKVIRWESIPEDIFWSIFRQRFAESPKLCAQRSGIPLDRLHDFADPAEIKPIKLESLYTDWLNRPRGNRKPVNPNWQKHLDNFWREFTESVNVESVDLLKREHFQTYYQSLFNRTTNKHKWAKRLDKKLSATSINQRIDHIKSVFRYGQDDGKVIADAAIAARKELIKSIDHDDTETSESNPITREHFTAIMDKTTDLQMKAGWLLSINLAYYCGDLENLKVADVDFSTGIVMNRRQKKGRVKRIGILWERSLTALKEWMATPEYENRADKELVFSHNADWFRDNWVDLRKKASVPFSVKHNNCRDAAYTIATDDVSVEAASVLAGHRLKGMTDKYYRRAHQIVKPACDAIERHYFPPT